MFRGALLKKTRSFLWHRERIVALSTLCAALRRWGPLHFFTTRNRETFRFSLGATAKSVLGGTD